MSMKKKILNSIFLIILVLVTSCELPNNIDPKHAEEVSPNTLFTNALVSLVDQIGSISVNSNISRLLVQYQSEVTYVTESRYNFSDRQIPDEYSGTLYRDVLENLKASKAVIEATPETPSFTAEIKQNQISILEILSVYTYQVLVDAFGNVPYSEALMGAANSRPKYDDAATIYTDILSRLNTAIAGLNDEYDGFGSADVLYDGKVDLWKKFAASLKLRMGLRLADVTGFDSNTIVSEALASGVFTDETESAILKYIGVTPYVNSYYEEFVLNARKDFCPTNTIVEQMDTLSDPRRAIWFTEYPEGSGEFLGEPYGKQGASSYSKFSHFADMIRIDPKYPVIISDYVEVEFLLAEAAERGLGGVTDAESHYNNAILASMKYWGVTDGDAATYLAQPAVAYTTAKGDYKQKIGTQKWLGLFDRGDEAWAEWRRLDFPVLNVPANMTYSEIPVRMPYPYNENKMNKTNYDAAAAAIGGDKASTKIFWDKF
jgi:hypothetical protein